MYKPIFKKRSVLKFTHFTNKGYALFACVGREVIIGVLTAATIEASAATAMSRQTDKVTTDSTVTSGIKQLEEVQVVGTRAPLGHSQQSRMVTVLSRDDIQGAPVQSINDLLKMAAGADVRQRGPLGSQTDISLRGSNYEQIAILLNGISLNDPQTGHNAFDFPVDIADIERIEVIEGPACRVYGTQSLLGAINIITKKPTKPTLTAHLEGGSYGYLGTGARGAWTDGTPFAHTLSGSYMRSDGYSRSKAGTLNADYSTAKAFYQGFFSHPGIEVSWHAGISSKNMGSNTFYGAQWDDQYEHTLKTFTAIQAEMQQGKLHMKPAFYWNHNEDRFELFRDNPDKYPFNYHRANVFGLNLNTWFDSRLGRTALAAEMRNEDLVSTNLGETLDNPKHIHGSNRMYEHGLNRTNLTLIAEHNVVLRRFTLSAGVAAVKNTQADMSMRLYPSADICWRITDKWKVYASYNTSLRMPSVTEIYYSVGGHQADSHLKPEELQAVELGAKYVTNGINAKASLFYNRHKNLIDWIRHTSDGPDAPWQSVNFGHINAIGLHADLQSDLRKLMPWQHLLRRFTIGYAYMHQSQQEHRDIQSRYALEYLQNKLTASIAMNIYRKLMLDIHYRLQHRKGSYTDINGNPQTYGTYNVVDARLAWEATGYKLFFDVNNITNRKYVDYGNIPQPGTWVTGGISITL